MNEEKRKKSVMSAHDKDEEMLIRRLFDLDRMCLKRYSAVSTFFLSDREQACAESVFHLLDSHCKIMGGYDGAERSVVILLPDEDYVLEEDEIPYTILQIEYSEELSHRDILGSLLGLGIERSAVGDILVLPKKSYVFVIKEMSNYIKQSMIKAGRQNVTVSEISVDDVIIPERKTEEINTTVASVRLDSVIAEGFRLSRETAKSAVEKQLVQINHRLVTTASHSVRENDVITLHGKGKIILQSVSGESRKGRIWIKILRLI